MSQNKHVWYRADNTVGKITKKQSEGVRFVNSALKIQCHVVKKTILQTAFSAILPTGK